MYQTRSAISDDLIQSTAEMVCHAYFMFNFIEHFEYTVAGGRSHLDRTSVIICSL